MNPAASHLLKLMTGGSYLLELLSPHSQRFNLGALQAQHFDWRDGALCHQRLRHADLALQQTRAVAVLTLFETTSRSS